MVSTTTVSADHPGDLARCPFARQRLAMDLLGEVVAAAAAGEAAAAWCERRRAWALEHGVDVRPTDGGGARLHSLPPRPLQRGRRVQVTWAPSGACEVRLVSWSVADPGMPALKADARAPAGGGLAEWAVVVDEGDVADATERLLALIRRAVPHAAVSSVTSTV